MILSSGMLETFQQCRLTSFLETQNQECAERGAEYNLEQAKTAIGVGRAHRRRACSRARRPGSTSSPSSTPTSSSRRWGRSSASSAPAPCCALLSIIAWRIWRTAQLARDPLGTLICVGVLSMFVFQVFENVGMTMGIMPITGIPLPFMSYGGSSTLTAFAAIGLVLNVHMRRFS